LAIFFFSFGNILEFPFFITFCFQNLVFFFGQSFLFRFLTEITLIIGKLSDFRKNFHFFVRKFSIRTLRLLKRKFPTNRSFFDRKIFDFLRKFRSKIFTFFTTISITKFSTFYKKFDQKCFWFFFKEFRSRKFRSENFSMYITFSGRFCIFLTLRW